MALRRIVRQRGLRRLLAAWALSITGEWIFVVALAVYAFRSEGAVAVGLVGLIRMLPAAIFAPLVTTAAERGRRERVLLAVAGFRAAVTVVAAFVVAAAAYAASAALLAGIRTEPPLGLPRPAGARSRGARRVPSARVSAAYAPVGLDVRSADAGPRDHHRGS